jgi:hypothetical protein
MSWSNVLVHASQVARLPVMLHLHSVRSLRTFGHELPDGIHIRPIYITCSIPAPTPHYTICEMEGQDEMA